MSTPREWIEAVERHILWERIFHRDREMTGKNLSLAQRNYLTWWVEFNLKTPVGCDITNDEIRFWAQYFEDHNTYVKER